MKVIQEVASRYDPADVHGTLVLLHVVNVTGYLAQQRYVPIYDLDLNRSFPGKAIGSTAERVANEVYRRWVTPCDFGIDFPPRRATGPRCTASVPTSTIPRWSG